MSTFALGKLEHREQRGLRGAPNWVVREARQEVGIRAPVDNKPYLSRVKLISRSLHGALFEKFAASIKINARCFHTRLGPKFLLVF